MGWWVGRGTYRSQRGVGTYLPASTRVLAGHLHPSLLPTLHCASSRGAGAPSWPSAATHGPALRLRATPQVSYDELSYNGLGLDDFVVQRSAAYISQVRPLAAAGALIPPRGCRQACPCGRHGEQLLILLPGPACGRCCQLGDQL